MVYNEYEDMAAVTGFDLWFDKLQQDQKHVMIDDILPDILGSGLHEYNGISTDWRFTHTGRGFF